MKNPLRFWLCAAVLSVLSWPAHAVLIGFYPGLDTLIKEADTVAIIRIETSVLGGPDGWTRPDCYVYQTLKGNLKANRRVPISLNQFVGARSGFDGAFLAPGSTHLVFLRYDRPAVNGANYSILQTRGADLLVSPLGNEKKPAGKNLKAQIQTLIRRYKIYRDAQIRREDQLLEQALAEKTKNVK